MDLKSRIRAVPDFPKKGIVFRDITPLLLDGEAFRHAVDQFAERFIDKKVDKILGAEARGFIFGAACAYRMGVGFIPARKPGKLPCKTSRMEYGLEYGVDALEIHYDAIKPGDRILIIDDLVATGGTAKAKTKLVEQESGTVVGIAFVIELSYLKPRELLGDYDIFTLIEFSSEEEGI